ncbi:hypothetical protein GUJ93_ZPchr0002g24761 [Zizania palustris]|uniref:Uncharacterized protein n=1 Tax=Zizania palustris TaxID=103762 RepID=A0A8J5S3S9_ZIZPA|nr:hypothetical protein GUJ93_ZPchr0002g24761 [Zizania palustris]
MVMVRENILTLPLPPPLPTPLSKPGRGGGSGGLAPLPVYVSNHYYALTNSDLDTLFSRVARATVAAG